MTTVSRPIVKKKDNNDDGSRIMPPYLFLSYSRQNADPYLDEFLTDLVGEISGRTGQPRPGLCFRDTQAIGLGETWTHELAEALRTARTFLALYSPAYFNSEYCGREWQVFVERMQEYAAARTLAAAPPLIVPVLWYPIDPSRRPLPTAVSLLQFDHARLGKTYAREGLQYLLRLRMQREYHEVVTELAKRLIEVGESHPLEPSSRTIDFTRLASAFHGPDPAPGSTPAPTPPPRSSGPGHVEFYVVAGSSSEMEPLRALSDRYGDTGLAWRPYAPAFVKRAAAFAQEVAGNADLSSSVHEVGPDLIERLRQANRSRHIVVLLVDAWALHLPACFDRMRDYDERDFWNCAVVLPWDDEDPPTCDQRERLLDLIAAAFENKATPARAHTFRGLVGSPRKLRGELTRVLCEIRKQIVERSQVARRALGARIISQPHLVGPGGG